MRKDIRVIGIFTGNRAEYGLQYPILKAIDEDPRLDYRLIVSGAHLKEDFGATIKEIRSDGFHVDAEVIINSPSDTLQGTTQAIGSGIWELSKVLFELEIDALLVYADRFEGFAAVVAGTQMRIPTAHVEGGDYTEGGALDDSVRHAMTKLAHLHFTTNQQAADRVIGLGEEPWRVFDVGLPVLDLVVAGSYAKSSDIYDQFALDPDRPILIFTQHSVTTEFDKSVEQIRPSLNALERAGEKWNCQSILTYPNDDAGGRTIIRELEKWAARRLPYMQVHRSLGRYTYHGLLNVASVCIGNSSSGIKETLSFHCPFVNIGTRQQGRLRGENVIDAGYDVDEILTALELGLTNREFRARIHSSNNPYNAGGAGPAIADILATIAIDHKLIQKKMTY